MLDTSLEGSPFPSYVLGVHSSRAVLVEQIPMPESCLADTVLELVTKMGKRHEVMENMHEIMFSICQIPSASYA